MRTLLLMMSLMMLTAGANAEVREDLVYVNYTAHAEPGGSILSALNAASPIRQDGHVYHGHTSWNVKWNYRWHERANGSCSITSVSLEVSGKITLPVLVGATVAQAGQFDRYVSALRVHELGHYGIAKDAAAAIETKIRALPEMSSCRNFGSAANDAGSKILDEYRAKEIRYDATTGHGKTQGAFLDG